MLRLAALAVSGLALAACGGDDKDAERALDRFNGGYSAVLLRESLEKGNGVSFCRLGPQPGRNEIMLLTVVMKTDIWLQATIDPDRTLRIEDVTTGKNFTQLFGSEGEALRKRDKACTVSPADGKVSLA